MHCFATELKKTQERFNQTFGNQVVTDRSTRQAVILSIVQMGLLYHKTMQTRDKEQTKTLSRRFTRIRDGLERIFDAFEQHTNPTKEGGHVHAVRNRSLPQMRQCVPG